MSETKPYTCPCTSCKKLIAEKDVTIARMRETIQDIKNVFEIPLGDDKDDHLAQIKQIVTEQGYADSMVMSKREFFATIEKKGAKDE